MEFHRYKEYSSAAVELEKTKQEMKVLKEEKKLWEQEKLKLRQENVALQLKVDEKEMEIVELKSMVESLGGDSGPPKRRSSLCEKLKPSLNLIKARMSNKGSSQEGGTTSKERRPSIEFTGGCKVSIQQKDVCERFLMLDGNQLQFYAANDYGFRTPKEVFEYNRETVKYISEEIPSVGFFFFGESGQKEVLMFMEDLPQLNLLIEALKKILPD